MQRKRISSDHEQERIESKVLPIFDRVVDDELVDFDIFFLTITMSTARPKTKRQ